MDNAVLEQNALVINTGNQLVLFDTGLGSLNIFGPTTGKLLNNLKQAGIDPKDIDAVVMSHAHIDHLGGNVADNGSVNFPNAQFYITQADHDFWTDYSKVPAEFKVFADTANKNLKPVRDRIQFIKDGQEVVPGVHAIARARPHRRPHHLHDRVRREAALLHRRLRAPSGAAAGEAADRVQVRHRSEAVGADRGVKNLTMLAEKRIPILAYHFAWPGIGHVVKQGDGFRYLPAPMEMDLSKAG